MARRLHQVCRVLLCATLAFAALKDHHTLSPRQRLLQRLENKSKCRCFPVDDCWPTEHESNVFNQTLEGKLIAMKPIASVCHLDPFAAYAA